MIHVALVTDRAGSFATLLHQPVPRFLEGGRVLVTTLATFACEHEARAFLDGLKGIESEKRERQPAELAVLERHGITPVGPSAA